MPAERKRIVILTRDGPEHRYVVNTLCAGITIDRIIVDRSAPRANIRAARRKGFRHFLSKAARRTFLQLINDDNARIRSLQRLFANKGEIFDEPEKIDFVDGINNSETITRLQQLQPSALLV